MNNLSMLLHLIVLVFVLRQKQVENEKDFSGKEDMIKIERYSTLQDCCGRNGGFVRLELIVSFRLI